MFLKKVNCLLISAFIITIFSSQIMAAEVHDFDISYYRYVNTDTVKNRDAKTIEDIIFYWADALYEATNGEC